MLKYYSIVDIIIQNYQMGKLEVESSLNVPEVAKLQSLTPNVA